jgi:hypothetical protein
MRVRVRLKRERDERFSQEQFHRWASRGPRGSMGRIGTGTSAEEERESEREEGNLCEVMRRVSRYVPRCEEV